VPQDPHQHQRDRLAEVQDPAGGDPLGAGEQGPGMGQDPRVVVHIDHPDLGGDPLGHLVGVVGGGQAGADVQELADPNLTSQVRDGTGEEPLGGPCDLHDPGRHN
jgi:hypothetical protein